MGESRNTASVREQAAKKALGVPPQSEPWREAMQERYNKTRAEYLGSAKYLRSEFGAQFESQANDLEDFAKNLPAPTTRLDLEVQRQQQAANRQQRDLDRGSER